MRTMAFLGKFASLGAVLLTAGVALAGSDQFDVVAGKGEVVVTTKNHYHVNKDYPWKATVGGVTFDKSKFSLSETVAKVTGIPAGTVQLKGAVCIAEGTDSKCVPFTKEIVIK